MTITLSVTKRDVATSRDTLQVEDKIPAVVYGPKQESIALSVDRRDFMKTFKQAGESTIVELTGLDEPLEVLVHDLDFHPSKGFVQHIDFYAFERGKEMTTEVPIHFVGHAPIEKGGGMVNKVLHEITVTCRPSKLPSAIEVDVSGLAEEDQQITVADLPELDGVTYESEADEIVALAVGAREEEPETEPETVDLDAVEVEAKGKSEEDTADVEERE